MKVCLRCSESFATDDWVCPSCGAEPARDPFLRFTEAAPDTYHPELFGLLEQVEPRSFWFRARNRLIAWTLDRYFPDARSLIEVGCGTGFVLAGIGEARPSLSLTGVDAFSEGLEVARRRSPSASLLQADARRLPFVDEFDVAGVFDVLEHIDDDEAILAELARVLKPGGGLLVTVPQHRWLWSQADTVAAHRRRYSRSELERKLQGAGFTLLRLTSFVTFLLPAMAAARLKTRSGDYDLADEFAIPPTLDRAFAAVMDAERGLIRAGVSLPAGGSLLAVAHRAAR